MKDLVLHRENTYFIILLVFSVIIYLALIVSIAGIIYVLLFALVYLFMQGFFVAQIRANAVKLSSQQFSDVYQIVQDMAREMGFKSIPDVYLLQSGGLLNAFATRFLSRNFVVIYSEIFELAYSKGKDALRFVIAHELGHIQRKHLQNRWLIIPGFIIPFLGTAYLRACEYTCDRFGKYYSKSNSTDGLIILAAGKVLYEKVNVEEYMKQIETERGFFVWFAEKCATHPNLTKRVKQIKDMKI